MFSSSSLDVDEDELTILFEERRLAIWLASCLLLSSLYLAIRRSAELVDDTGAFLALSVTCLRTSSGGSPPLLGSRFCIFLTFSWLFETYFWRNGNSLCGLWCQVW